MCKGFDMIGWRLGFVAGHQQIVQAFADVKDNTDSGQFMAIQKAAVAGLDDPSIPQGIRGSTSGASRKLVTTLQRVGLRRAHAGRDVFPDGQSPARRRRAGRSSRTPKRRASG